MQTISEMTATAAALADPNRIRILAALMSGAGEERCACELTGLLDLAPSTVSRHLAVLRQAGLIESRRDGRWIYSRPASKPGVHAAGAQAWVRRALATDPVLRSDREKLDEIAARLRGGCCPVEDSAVERPARVLFLCTGNSCRSQMAEGWANALLADRIEAMSAGTRPTSLNPLAVKAMAERGVDISRHRSKHVDELISSGARFDCVVSVCDDAAASCPSQPQLGLHIRAPFEDPPRLAATATTEEESLRHYRRVRDELHDFVLSLPDRLPEQVAELWRSKDEHDEDRRNERRN